MFVVAYGSPRDGFRLHGPFADVKDAEKWGEEMGEGGEWPMEVHPIDDSSCHRLYPWSAEGEPKPGHLRAVRWCFDDAFNDGDVPSYTYPGFWDGSRWNGWPNLMVTPTVWADLRPVLEEDMKASYEPGTEDWADAMAELDERGKPGLNGLCSIGWGYTPTIVKELP